MSRNPLSLKTTLIHNPFQSLFSNPSLQSSDPFGFNDSFSSTFDSFIDDFFNSRNRPLFKELYQTGLKFPKVEISVDEPQENLIYRFHVSGYPKESIHIEYDEEKGTLKIWGSSSSVYEGETSLYSESKKSSFTRVIPLDKTKITNLDGIKTCVKDGILEIKVPYDVEELKKFLPNKKVDKIPEKPKTLQIQIE